MLIISPGPRSARLMTAPAMPRRPRPRRPLATKSRLASGSAVSHGLLPRRNCSSSSTALVLARLPVFSLPLIASLVAPRASDTRTAHSRLPTHLSSSLVLNWAADSSSLTSVPRRSRRATVPRVLAAHRLPDLLSLSAISRMTSTVTHSSNTSRAPLVPASSQTPKTAHPRGWSNAIFLR